MQRAEALTRDFVIATATLMLMLVAGGAAAAIRIRRHDRRLPIMLPTAAVES